MLPKRLAFGIQRKLHFLSYSCCYADNFTSGLFENGDSRMHWQTAVDALYRLIKGELIWSPPVSDQDPIMKQKDYLAYLMRLARSDPGDPHADTEWYAMDFCLTDEARRLIEKHKIREHAEELCPPFIDELEQRFEANGVGWRDEPLISIRRA